MVEQPALVIVGGGLQAALLALAVRARAPSTRVTIVERGAALGGNHTWCFHGTDVSPRMAGWIAPLVGHRWDGHEVAFPSARRTLGGSYHAIPSARVDAAVRATGAEVVTDAHAVTVAPGAVTLADGRVLTAPWIVDARGPDRAEVTGGWQKFVGVELATAAPHGVTRPLLMDACVEQRDGYRFVYVLPLAPDRLLIEDTMFSDGAYLDVGAGTAACLAYAAARGWHGEIVRTETGVLPMPWQCAVVAPRPGLIVAGYQGGWFHPVTGYSLPVAARLAEAIADGLADGDVLAAVTAAARAHTEQLGFACRLAWMMFRWFPPDERRGVLEHFYRLPEDTIARFYALTFTRRDRARVFLRRPPRGLSWRARHRRSPRGDPMSQTAPRPDWTPLLADALDATWRGDGFDPAVPPTLWDHALRAPLDEFVRRPGKELRAVVCGLGWALGGGAGPMPEDVALVIDGLHTGSLIIDDLEDGADERRGRPAFHLLHGDPAAINSGTWLYCWALERIALLGGDAATQLHMHRRAIAVLRECHQGQALDLQARVDELDIGRAAAVCAAITRGKTAALAGFAVELAALAAGACPRNAAGAARLGHTIGTVLQMLDDVGSLGLTRRAKGHEDLRARRVTWPWAWLPEVTDALTGARLRERVRHLDTVAALDGLADELHARVAPFARHRIRLEIDAGLALAHHDHHDHPAVRTAAALLARMEESYG